MRLINFVLAYICIIFILISCTPQSKVKSRIRIIEPQEASAYHKPLKVQIGWYPYDEQKLVKTATNEYMVVNNDSIIKKGNIPVIMLSYQDSSRVIWLDVDMDNELLGKLIKHSLMTEIPVKRPYTDYLEVADCKKCHPSSIQINE